MLLDPLTTIPQVDTFIGKFSQIPPLASLIGFGNSETVRAFPDA